MRIPHHLLLAGTILLASCGGGGGGGEKDTHAQPTSFLPTGVTTATLQFENRSALPDPVQLTQKTESTKSENATWTATVNSGVMTIPLSNGTRINAQLIGEVEVTRQAGDQGFLLTWRSPSSYTDGEAALEGTMQLRYYNTSDNAGLRLASVSIPGIKLVCSDNGTKLEENFAPGLDGSTVRVTFTPPQTQTPPATDNTPPSTE